MAKTMRHPALPPDQTIEVPDEAVMGHQRMGWRPVEDEKPAEKTVEYDEDLAAAESEDAGEESAEESSEETDDG